MAGEYPAVPLRDRVVPPRGFVPPIGPSNFPVELPPEKETPLSVLRELRQLVQNLMDQNAARAGIIRAADVTDAGQTLDWSQFGDMARVMMRNKGPDSLWFSFNEDGQNVPPTTGDGSFEIQAQEAISIPNILFQKIGVRCATGDTATIHAIAFQKSFGDFGGSIV